MLVDQHHRARRLRHQVAAQQLPDVLQRRQPRANVSPLYALGPPRFLALDPLPSLWERARMRARLPQLEQRSTGCRLQLVDRALPKGVVAGALDCPEDGALVAKADLTLGGMNVDVDLGGIHPQVEYREREPIGLAQPQVSLLNSKGQVAVVDATPVEQDHDVPATGPVQRRRTDQTGHDSIVDREHGGGGRRVVDRGKGRAPVAGSRGFQDAPVVDVEEDPDGRMRQGQLADQSHDDRAFGGGLLEEFKTGRGVEEQPADAHPSPNRTPGRTGSNLRAALDQHAVPLSPIARPADRLHARDRGDARQRLAPESEGANRSQVVERANLARGVPQKRERQVDRGHPLAVVDNLDQALPGGLDPHLDP